jgi:protein SCO1/2
MNRLNPALIAAAAVALVAGVVLGGLVLPRDVEVESATLLSPARPLPEFELIRDDATGMTRADLAGDWSLMFFGFTHCPDICPATLETLAAVKRRLEREGDPVPRVIFTSVDPERDDPGTLADYVHYFDPAFVGVTGRRDAIDRLTRELGIISARVWNEERTAYTVDHSASVLLIDPDARLRAVFGTPHRVEPMARDIAAILEGRAVPSRDGGNG